MVQESQLCHCQMKMQLDVCSPPSLLSNWSVLLLSWSSVVLGQLTLHQPQGSRSRWTLCPGVLSLAGMQATRTSSSYLASFKSGVSDDWTTCSSRENGYCISVCANGVFFILYRKLLLQKNFVLCLPDSHMCSRVDMLYKPHI